MKIIKKDAIEHIEFTFGAFRYVIEHFNNNGEFNTIIYKFDDYLEEVCTYKALNNLLTQEDVESLILSDTINWNIEKDKSKYKEFFLDGDSIKWHFLFANALNKKRVNHKYKECIYPYEKCPHCGANIEELIEDPINAVDCFNSRTYFNGECECSDWEEIYRCTKCNKLFYIAESN